MVLGNVNNHASARTRERRPVLPINQIHWDVGMKKVKAAGLVIAFALVFLTVGVQPAMANPGTRLDSLYAFVNERYDTVNGGFTLVGSEASRTEATYYAVEILDDLGYLTQRPPIYDWIRVKNFTQNVQWRSGGEDSSRYGGIGPIIAVTPDMTTNYLGIKSWNKLNAIADLPGIANVEELNYTALVFHVNKSQSVDGGFGMDEDSPPDLHSTYMALYIIDSVIGETEWTMDDILLNRTQTIEWILSCREGDAFMLSPASSTPGVTPTAAGLMSLEILNSVTRLGADSQAIRNWILDRQMSEYDGGDSVYGGFEEGALTNDSNIITTYYALQGLAVINALGEVDAEIAARFILDCQAANGGWGNVPGLQVGIIENAGMAILSLRILGDDYSAMIYEEDPNDPTPPLLDWRVLFVAGFIVVAAVIALIALRMD